MKRNIAQVDLTSTESEPTIEATFDDDFQRMAFKGFQVLEADERAFQHVAPEVEPVVNTKRTKLVKPPNNPARNTRSKVANPARNTRSQERIAI